MTHGKSRDPDICCVRTPHPSLVAAWLTVPALRGRPLILGGLAHERASVTTASAEARAQGVVEGMSLNQAQQFAPDAVFQPVDEEATARVRQSLLLTLHHFTPDVAAGEDPGCAFLRLDRLTLRWPDRTKLLAAISRAIDAAIGFSVRTCLPASRANRVTVSLLTPTSRAVWRTPHPSARC